MLISHIFPNKQRHDISKIGSSGFYLFFVFFPSLDYIYKESLERNCDHESMWYFFIIQIIVGPLWISTKNSIPYTKLSTYFWSCHQSFSTQWKLLTIWYPLSVLKSTAFTMVSDTYKFSKPTNQIINLSLFQTQGNFMTWGSRTEW